MKKTILVGAIALISFSSFAQSKGAKDSGTGITYGVKAGLTFAGQSSSNSDYDGVVMYGRRTSFYVGGVANVPVSSMFSLQPGVTLVGKGYSGEKPSSNGTITTKLTPLYLEVPVNMIANFDTGAGKFFVGAGPYIAFALSGKIKNSLVVNGVTDENYIGKQDRDIKFGTNSNNTASADEKDLKSLDFGLNFLVGYQLTNGVSINAGYGLGLANIHSDTGKTNNKESTKNSVFSVGLGFTF